MSSIETLSNPNGLAYYNGTACPFISMADMDFIKNTNDMIVLGLKMGVSLKQQGIDYKKQMDFMEYLTSLATMQYMADQNPPKRRNIE